MSRFDDRLAVERYSNDEPVMIALVELALPANLVSSKAARFINLPERVIQRLRLIATAYELHYLANIDCASEVRLNRAQTEGLLEELEFVSSTSNDTLLLSHIKSLQAICSECSASPHEQELLFVGP